MPQAQRSEPRRWRWPVGGIVACTALAALLRLLDLGGQSLWVDEELTVHTVLQSWAGFWHSSVGDNNSPPLYFLATKGVVAVLGDSEAAVRLVSAVSGSLSVALVICLVLALGYGSATALLAGFLMAIHPLHIWFSQEARPYALMVFFGLGALTAAARGLRTGGRRAWGLFALSAICAFYCHVTAIAFVAAAWLWMAVERPPRKAWTGLAAGSAVFAAAAVPMALYIASIQVSVPPPRAMTGLELPYALYALIGGLSLGPSVREIQVAGADALKGAWVSLCAVAMAWGAVAFAAARRRQGLGIWASVILAPLATAFAVALLRDFPFNVRYVLGSVAGVAGLVACMAAEAGRWLRTSLLVLFVAIFGTATFQWFANPRYAKDDARAAVAWLKTHAPAGSVIAVAPLYAEAVVEYYAQRQGLEADILPAESAQDLANLPRFDALVITRRQHVPCLEEMLSFVRQRGGEAARADFPGFEVLLLSPPVQGPI